MSRGAYSIKLARQFFRFAMERKAYWILPLIMLLGLVSLLVITGQAGAPLLYTLF